MTDVTRDSTPRCESCGQPAEWRTGDGGTWCDGCHFAALNLGYDTDRGTPIHASNGRQP